MNPIQNPSLWLQKVTGLPSELNKQLLLSFAVIVFIMLLRSILFRVVHAKFDDLEKRYHWRKGISRSLSVLAVLMLGRIWYQGGASAATFFGLFAASLTIALQDVVRNFAGWIFILWRTPFKLGDRIEIAGKSGDVIDQRIFMFSLMEIGNWVSADQSTGRVLHIPNGTVFKEAVANYSRGIGYIWNEIPILVTFESNWEHAKQILQDIADSHTRSLSIDAEKQLRSSNQKHMIFYKKLNAMVWTSVQNSGVLLTVRYLCEPQKRRNSEHEIWESVLKVFSSQQDIDFAYNTNRVFHRYEEDKEEDKPVLSKTKD